MSVNILTYMLAASLIQGGMNWKQAVFTIFIGNMIVLGPMLLTWHNLHYYQALMLGLRAAIVQRRFSAHAASLRAAWRNVEKNDR